MRVQVDGPRRTAPTSWRASTARSRTRTRSTTTAAVPASEPTTCSTNPPYAKLRPGAAMQLTLTPHHAKWLRPRLDPPRRQWNGPPVDGEAGRREAGGLAREDETEDEDTHRQNAIRLDVPLVDPHEVLQVSHPTARAVSSAASRSSGNSRDPCGNPKRHMRRPPPGTSPFPPSPTPTLRRQGRHPETRGPPRPVRRRGRSGRSRERWRGRARGVEPGAAVLPPSRIERRSDEPGRTPPRGAAA